MSLSLKRKAPAVPISELSEEEKLDIQKTFDAYYEKAMDSWKKDSRYRNLRKTLPKGASVTVAIDQNTGLPVHRRNKTMKSYEWMFVNSEGQYSSNKRVKQWKDGVGDPNGVGAYFKTTAAGRRVSVHRLMRRSFDKAKDLLDPAKVVKSEVGHDTAASAASPNNGEANLTQETSHAEHCQKDAKRNPGSRMHGGHRQHVYDVLSHSGGRDIPKQIVVDPKSNFPLKGLFGVALKGAWQLGQVQAAAAGSRTTTSERMRNGEQAIHKGAVMDCSSGSVRWYKFSERYRAPNNIKETWEQREERLLENGEFAVELRLAGAPKETKLVQAMDGGGPGAPVRIPNLWVELETAKFYDMDHTLLAVGHAKDGKLSEQDRRLLRYAPAWASGSARRLPSSGRNAPESHVVWWSSGGKVPPGMSIDHINRDHSDNRISNLRAATHSEQRLNQKVAENVKAVIIKWPAGVPPSVLGSIPEGAKVQGKARHEKHESRAAAARSLLGRVHSGSIPWQGDRYFCSWSWSSWAASGAGAGWGVDKKKALKWKKAAKESSPGKRRAERLMYQNVSSLVGVRGDGCELKGRGVVAWFE